MTDEELNALENNLAVRGKQDREMSNHYVHRMEVDRVAAKSAITALRECEARLRAQLAEARGDATVLCDALRRAEIAAAGAREERDSLITRADRADDDIENILVRWTVTTCH